MSSSSNLRPTARPGGRGDKNQPPVVYRPQIYRFRCRGGLHLDDVDASTGLPACTGIATKLQHVMDLPPVTSKVDAVRMFEGYAPDHHRQIHDQMSDDGEYDADARARRKRLEALTTKGGGANYGRGGTNNDDPPPDDSDGVRTSVSCYGSTEVSVLQVEEMDSVTQGSDPMIDLFHGGKTAAGGRPFDPFGGVFGDLDRLFDVAQKGGGRERAGMRSVSSTQRTRIVDGNRVTTKETTTIENGKWTKRTETIVQKPDGTVETTVVGDDNDRDRGVNDEVTTDGDAQPVFPPPNLPRLELKPPEIIAVSPECRLGVTVSDSEAPDGSGETVATFRVGPLEVAVGNHYETEEADDDERSRGLDDSDATKARRRQSGGKWRDDADTDADARNLTVDVPALLEKTAKSMKRNARLLKESVSDDFPTRVAKSGERIALNFGKTLERTSKVASDVYRMWFSDGRDDDR